MLLDLEIILIFQILINKFLLGLVTVPFSVNSSYNLIPSRLNTPRLHTWMGTQGSQPRHADASGDSP